MLDSEKVIKDLEEISDYFFGIYHHSKDREEINKAKDRCNAVEEAISLLKEQDELLKHEYWRGYTNGRADERGLQEGTIMQTFSPD